MAMQAQTSRLAGPIDSRRSVLLRGHVHPQASAANDRGAVASSFPVPGITVMLKPSASQNAALQQLLAEQQDPASPRYHQWLTPEQYADAYGVSADDISRITAWLESQGFTVDNVARSRLSITFSGTADQVANAFHTQIHRYQVNGRMHYANATEPSVPAALSGMISSLRGLNDFRLKPRLKAPAHPDMNTTGGAHHLAPDDIATIYNIAPLYSAGVDGTGQTIAVVGQTNVNLTDIQQFRTRFNLSTPNFKKVLVPGRPNPGIVDGDVQEADLDIEWSGAIARNAQIVYVYSDDVIQSLMYAIDSNVAPVLSMSYGGCEPADLSDLPSFQQLAQQGNAQGITWITAAGDSGAADCEDSGATIAQDGFAADMPGVIPEVTSMGGTTLSDSGGSYWAASNTANGASALSYIPETVWNDTPLGFGLASTGGGASIFFPQPIWQIGAGVPNDGYRHVPDLSLSASAEHDGYFVYTGGSSAYFGGTSVAAPTMAGIVALLNQYLASTGVQPRTGLGNINPQLYRLAQTTTGIFHDITTGNNNVPCVAGSPNCVGGTFGNAAGPGYDSATGLGSVDAFNLVHGWSTKPLANSAVLVSLDQNPVFQQPADVSGNGWRFVLTLTEEGGIPTTLTGLSIDGADFTARIPALFGGATLAANAARSANIGLSNVAAPKNVAIVVSGVDASGATWTQQLSIPFAGPQIPITIAGISNAASGQQVFAPGMIMSIYGTQLGNFVQPFGTVPLPQYLAGFEAWVNGVPAPLYYVSPNQVNIQIPYETQPGKATLTVGNPYNNVDSFFQVNAAAPGIFTAADGSLVPFSTATRGQTITLYLTGDGQVSPSLSTGSAPSANTPLTRLPKPQQAASITVGGVAAPITFIGIPPGYVGVTQVNFTIPAGTPSGVQAVIVTIGSASSSQAKLTVQ
ncbi:MAG TPA: protease pro-enzyme activation domain-containing protein [Candidatus Sulfopaludibacter sp.]|jgi:uncharacterized protein (TIGR03437 family)|nr:protease pro-enzyme activation domain-containing protein [Candidatus Sulfopaludibacter sp.]